MHLKYSERGVEHKRSWIHVPWGYMPLHTLYVNEVCAPPWMETLALIWGRGNCQSGHSLVLWPRSELGLSSNSSGWSGSVELWVRGVVTAYGDALAVSLLPPLKDKLERRTLGKCGTKVDGYLLVGSKSQVWGSIMGGVLMVTNGDKQKCFVVLVYKFCLLRQESTQLSYNAIWMI